MRCGLQVLRKQKRKQWKVYSILPKKSTCNDKYFNFVLCKRVTFSKCSHNRKGLLLNAFYMPETIFGPRTSPCSNARKIDNNEASVLLHDCLPCSGQPTNIETVLTCIFIPPPPPPGPYKEGWGLGTPCALKIFGHWSILNLTTKVKCRHEDDFYRNLVRITHFFNCRKFCKISKRATSGNRQLMRKK